MDICLFIDSNSVILFARSVLHIFHRSLEFIMVRSEAEHNYWYFLLLLLPSCCLAAAVFMSVLLCVCLTDYTVVHNVNAVRTRIRSGGYHGWYWYPCCQIFISGWYSWSQTNTKNSPDDTHHLSCELFFAFLVCYWTMMWNSLWAVFL